MKQAIHHQQQQLGFDAMLKTTDTVNKARRREQEDADLPGDMALAIPFMHELISVHHAAMLRGDRDATMQCRRDAIRLAQKLNGYEPGILADDDAPGRVLDRLTAAPVGTVPQWGQSGEFIIECAGMRVRICMEGFFGIGTCYLDYMNFTANAVEWDKPFLSETGYRSFYGCFGALEAGYSPDAYAAATIGSHVVNELKGKIPLIQPEYRPG